MNVRPFALYCTNIQKKNLSLRLRFNPCPKEVVLFQLLPLFTMPTTMPMKYARCAKIVSTVSMKIIATAQCLQWWQLIFDKFQELDSLNALLHRQVAPDAERDVFGCFLIPHAVLALALQKSVFLSYVKVKKPHTQDRRMRNVCLRV